MSNQMLQLQKTQFSLSQVSTMTVVSETIPSPAYVEAVEEIMEIYKSLPPRPTIEEVEAATSVIETANTEEKARLEEISGQTAPQDVPPELISVLQQVRKTMALFQSQEQRKEAAHLVNLDMKFQKFDELIQRASQLISGGTQQEKTTELNDPVGEIEIEAVILKKGVDGELKSDGGFIGLKKSSSSKATILLSGEVGHEKMSLIQVAALIEKTAKNGARVLDLRDKLMEKIEWLPLSLGKLTMISELYVSGNRIMALPTTISNLKSLTKLDLHSNQLINLPESFGELLGLTDLDLHSNTLKSLPPSFGHLTNLIDLDLSSNSFTHLPDTIGKLASLMRLNVETNHLEELPYTIGSCSSLVELRLDFNELKALPEAVGKLECLEVLTLHYNRIRGLPTTMSNLMRLKELDVSFNELEYVPESLCLVVSLVKLNVANNFADLKSLPKSIGNLEMLEELDISDDQIRVLPDSFRLLSKLRVFRAAETPLEVPPREVAKLGAQVVVQYMADFVAKRNQKVLLPKKKKGFFSRVCSLCCH